ncbi:MotE family protein [Arenibaculum pallidiluteum]|uniref:MotE family protein n=1 Tax=Arenibaculum pallidiluteum TaxID=2812559 RepID=UPI001A979CF5|nr:flagellar motor switch protein [Arenibaculum pallidiluteum]
MLRVIPLTLVALMLVLPLKLGSLVEGFPAFAQQVSPGFGAHDRPWAKDLKAAADSGARAAPAPAAPQGETQATSLPSAQLPAGPLANCGDPALASAIADQRSEIDRRSRRLADAEAVLSATEMRIGTQLDRLRAVKRDVEALMQQRSDLAEEDLKRMVAIYEAMKPKDAARIFGDLETDMVIDLLDRLPERRSAPIIAELADAKAREVTRAIMQRRQLPGDRRAAEGKLVETRAPETRLAR